MRIYAPVPLWNVVSCVLTGRRVSAVRRMPASRHTARLGVEAGRMHSVTCTRGIWSRVVYRLIVYIVMYLAAGLALRKLGRGAPPPGSSRSLPGT